MRRLIRQRSLRVEEVKRPRINLPIMRRVRPRALKIQPMLRLLKTKKKISQ